MGIEYCNPILGSFLPCLDTLVILSCLVVVLVWTKYGKFQKKLKISTFQLFLHFSGLSQPYFRLLWSFWALVVLTIPKICVVVRFVARVTMLWRCVVVCCWNEVRIRFGGSVSPSESGLYRPSHKPKPHQWHRNSTWPRWSLILIHYLSCRHRYR